MQADSAARVIKCVFEIRNLKQRIPGLVGASSQFRCFQKV